ncbi:MAG: sulfur carrier protein ThiS [Planctomycetales bacterium]|jgi:sulfur carrier protein|nr:sulfur carrier protein ThiS [Planctomycetales bacterium]RLS78249.1 MAG: sulfur carrier protein ThiS [Planctomycetota bacterium]
MRIQLNGEPREIPDSWSIADLLADLKIENRYCAVERNRSVVPREQHAACSLLDGDQIEVVTLVGGG